LLQSKGDRGNNSFISISSCYISCSIYSKLFFSKKKNNEKEKNYKFQIIDFILDELKLKDKVYMKDIIIKYKVTRQVADETFNKIVKDYGFYLDFDENGEIFIKK